MPLTQAAKELQPGDIVYAATHLYGLLRPCVYLGSNVAGDGEVYTFSLFLSPPSSYTDPADTLTGFIESFHTMSICTTDLRMVKIEDQVAFDNRSGRISLLERTHLARELPGCLRRTIDVGLIDIDYVRSLGRVFGVDWSRYV